jgi:predicted regulator of Ras-like GTPase activity (Roadblock/LC7/MglB family)
MLLVENKDGLVMLAPLARGFVLALVGDSSAMLGAVRFEVKQTVPELNQLFA